MEVTTKKVNSGPLGHRWVPWCDVCKVKLPGRFADRDQAEGVTSAHMNDRHLSRLVERLERLKQ